jgi:hypothetical protein
MSDEDTPQNISFHQKSDITNTASRRLHGFGFADEGKGLVRNASKSDTIPSLQRPQVPTFSHTFTRSGMGKLFLWAGQMKKVKCQVGQLTFLLAIFVNNNKPETQTRGARIAKQ